MLLWLEETVSDLRHGLRGLRRNPHFGAVGVLAAALGIGASAAVFSAVDRVLFRPLPYDDEARLVSVGIMAPLDTNEFLLTEGYLDLRRDPGPLAAVSSFQAGAIACDLTDDRPSRLACLRVEANFLDLLGIRPAVGRSFSPEEDRPNGPRVAMISDGLWRSRYAADPRVPGRTLMLDGAPAVIVGVLPANFLMPTLAHADVLLPLALNSSRESSGRALRAFGKLKPGMTVEGARAALAPYLARVLESVPPRFRKEVTLRVRPVRDRQLGDVRLASLTLLGAVLAVLLIACANLANLLLARGAGRDREMAVRAALGASRARLVRQALAESTLLGLAGGAAGCALAFAMLRIFRALGPGSLPRLEEATLDLRVLGFTVGAALASGIAAGLPAAWRPTGIDGLRGARSTASGRGWMRGGLVAAQIAVSLTLLAGAGLLLRSLWNLQSVPLGLDGGHVVTASFSLGRQRYVEAERQLAFFADLETRLESLPGAQAVAISDSLPPTGGTRARPFSTIEVEGRPPAPEGTGGMVAWRYITPGYFDALGIPIRRGRRFAAEDRAAGAYSMIVSETLARRWFAAENPIGRRVLRGPGGEWFTVVGVAADVHNRGPADQPGPEFYLVRKPTADLTWQNQEPPMGWRSAFALVRTPVDPGLAAAELRRIAAGIDPTLPIEISTMRARLDTVTERPRFYATLLGSFAAIGVLLAATGLFGTMSFLVTQRRREIGIRMALGASAGSVLRHVLAFAARWAVVGVALGVPGAIVVARWLRGLLFHVSPADPGALTVSALLLAAVVMTAAIGPAWRAARVDPADTLRED
jgi:putative ABC transport system permease protein